MIDQYIRTESGAQEWLTARSCMEHLMRNINLWCGQAAADWSTAFRELMYNAHSMRVVNLNMHDKPKRQLRHSHCDACARSEYRCDQAIDIAVNSRVNMNAFRSTVDTAMEAWPIFIQCYEAEINECPAPSQFKSSDMGRFCTGSTCLRKSKLFFGISTVVLDLLYSAWIDTRTSPLTKLVNLHDLSTVHDDAITRLEAHIESIQAALPHDKGSVPDIQMDRSYWASIDATRNKLPSNALNLHTKRCLELGNGVAAHHRKRRASCATDEDSFIVNDDSDMEEEDNDDYTLGAANALHAHNPKRRVVLDSDSDGEDQDDSAPDTQQTLLRKSNSPRGTSSRQPTRGTGTLSGSSSGAKASAKAGAHSYPLLSDRCLLLSQLIELNGQLTREGRGDYAAALDAAILIIRECAE
tara:strand:+ start:119 stop:1351 length:1233 start_codon:yes stop_codon:yes gene_type:complete